ncbi:MAG: hypothetical protein HY820_01400 [Acidobacteria bacterium]|nr:hypothetical protein [Acidobacteriota bacterium]
MIHTLDIFRQLRRLPADQRGQDFVEYALMVAFVTTMAAVVLTFDFTPSLSIIWARVNGVLRSIGGA